MIHIIWTMLYGPYSMAHIIWSILYRLYRLYIMVFKIWSSSVSEKVQAPTDAAATILTLIVRTRVVL